MIGDYRVIDLHVHSHLSGCADDAPGYSAEAILRHASALGTDAVAFADHILDPAAALPTEVFEYLDERPGFERVEQLRGELAALELQGLPRVAVGCEVDVFADGAFSIAAALRARLDHAAFSANHPPVPPLPAPEGDNPEDVARYVMKKSRSAIRSGMATSLAHPFLPMGFPRAQEVYACYLPMGAEGLFEEARDAGIALGFSRHLVSSSQLVRHDDVRELYSAAARVGVKLAFETDSHSLWHMSCILPLVELARRFGLTPDRFISALPA
jgi:histidinol phosphatase-like PHP family hydrolase